MTPQSSPESDNEPKRPVPVHGKSTSSSNGFHQPRKESYSISASAPQKSDPLSQDFHGKPIAQHVKEFAGLIGIILLLFCGWYLYKRYSIADAGAFFITGWAVVALGYFTPRLFLPVWRAWMGLAAVLEVCSTYLILSLIWVGLFIPMSGLLRAIGRHTMDMSFRVNCESYWLDRSPAKSDFKLLERQY